MPLIARDTSRAQVDPVEPGVYIGVCYGVVDLGTHTNPTFNVEKHQVLITWELPDARADFEKDGEMVNQPRVISRRYTLSLSDKANLRKDLESWRGRKFTPDELEGFDLRAILGKPCQLQVVHETSKDGRMFANVATIMALPKGMSAPAKTENPQVYFSLEDAVENPELPEVPDWVKKIITESKEWQGLEEGGTAPARAVDAPEQGGEDDDDIPF